MEYKVGDIVKVANERDLVHCNEMIKIGKIGKNGYGYPLAIAEGDNLLGTPFGKVRATVTIKFGS